MKSEPNVFSFEDLKSAPHSTEPWDGIRNYQARNFMRDSMKKGDRVLFYHSSCETPGVVGIATVASDKAYPDATQFEPKSQYFDPKSTQENPRWLLVDIQYLKPLSRIISLKEIKEDPELSKMRVAQKGMRLSIQPVEKKHFLEIAQRGGVKL